MAKHNTKTIENETEVQETETSVEESTPTSPAAVTEATPEVKWPEYNAEGFAQCVNLSQQIRFLNSAGWPRGTIAKFLTARRGKLVRYQHVRNVLITPVGKKND